MASLKSLFLISGSQLFPVPFLKGHENDLIFMAEDREYSSSLNFHKHKIVFYISCMRHYAREIRHHDFNLVYFDMEETKGLSFDKILNKVMKESALKKITTFEIEDKVIEKRLQNFCSDNDYELEFKRNPGFINSRNDFKSYMIENKPPQFKAFYEGQRKRHRILLEPNGEPFGGRFTIDDEAHLKWTKKNKSPKIPASVHDEIDMAVIQFVDREFPENPGQALTFWYPTSRESALATLKDFCMYRLAEYGPYEEAICPDEDFLFHSVLSPLMNSGLLTPGEVVKTVLKHSAENPVPLHSQESFIRSVLGWREFVRGIYQNFSEQQEQGNFWKHHRIMNVHWRTGKTGVPPLDDAIKKAARLSYNHHIERLAVLCNMMNISELHPHEAYKWFSEMNMDSTPWATGPNVYGLGLHSDNGITADQVYICTSNYWFKISTYPKADWSEEVDGLYWRFVQRHRKFFDRNPKLYLMTKNLERLTAERQEVLWKAADAFLARNTIYP